MISTNHININQQYQFTFARQQRPLAPQQPIILKSHLYPTTIKAADEHIQENLSMDKVLTDRVFPVNNGQPPVNIQSLNSNYPLLQIHHVQSALVQQADSLTQQTKSGIQ